MTEDQMAVTLHSTRIYSLRGFAPSRRRRASPPAVIPSKLTPRTHESIYPSNVLGGENGFNQAIELSAETLANVKFVQEKRLLSSFFDQISQDTGKFCFGVRDTLSCLEMGAVETLIVYENLEITRLVYKTPEGSTDVKYLTKEQEGDGEHDWAGARRRGKQRPTAMRRQDHSAELIHPEAIAGSRMFRAV